MSKAKIKKAKKAADRRYKSLTPEQIEERASHRKARDEARMQRKLERKKCGRIRGKEKIAQMSSEWAGGTFATSLSSEEIERRSAFHTVVMKAIYPKSAAVTAIMRDLWALERRILGAENDVLINLLNEDLQNGLQTGTPMPDTWDTSWFASGAVPRLSEELRKAILSRQVGRDFVDNVVRTGTRRFEGKYDSDVPIGRRLSKSLDYIWFWDGTGNLFQKPLSLVRAAGWGLLSLSQCPLWIMQDFAEFCYFVDHFRHVMHHNKCLGQNDLEFALTPVPSIRKDLMVGDPDVKERMHALIELCNESDAIIPIEQYLYLSMCSAYFCVQNKKTQKWLCDISVLKRLVDRTE